VRSPWGSYTAPLWSMEYGSDPISDRFFVFFLFPMRLSVRVCQAPARHRPAAKSANTSLLLVVVAIACCCCFDFSCGRSPPAGNNDNNDDDNNDDESSDDNNNNCNSNRIRSDDDDDENTPLLFSAYITQESRCTLQMGIHQTSLCLGGADLLA
jgi:hypothetical protein